MSLLFGVLCQLFTTHWTLCRVVPLLYCRTTLPNDINLISAFSPNPSSNRDADDNSGALRQRRHDKWFTRLSPNETTKTMMGTPRTRTIFKSLFVVIRITALLRDGNHGSNSSTHKGFIAAESHKIITLICNYMSLFAIIRTIIIIIS